jgi:hypothetical protein
MLLEQCDSLRHRGVITAQLAVPTQLLNRHTCVPQATQESEHPEIAVVVHTPATSAALDARQNAFALVIARSVSMLNPDCAAASAGE